MKRPPVALWRSMRGSLADRKSDYDHDNDLEPTIAGQSIAMALNLNWRTIYARKERSRHRTGLFVGIVLFLACVGVASAQEGKGMAAPPDPEQPMRVQRIPQKAIGWSVRCTNPGKGLTCKATQTIGHRKTRKRLLSVSVSKPRKGKHGAMLLQLPLGLFLPAGATISIDAETPERLAIQTCNAKGCFSGAPLTPDKLTAMTTGTKLFVTFQNMKRQKIVVPVPLKGFAEAYHKL